MEIRSLAWLALPGCVVLSACGGDEGGGEGGGSSGSQGAGTGGSACAIFPDDNPWNTDISQAPVDPHSDAYIASMGLDTGLHPDFGTIYGIPYVYVDDSVQKSTVRFNYDDESDKGPYPIPANPPIEDGGDRHILMIQKDECKLYELFAAEESGGGWNAGSGAIFDLTSNDLRPDGWTSADAAGLPIFPGLARYDEAVKKKSVDHALRFTASRTQSAYAAPARHSAGEGNDPDLPPMGLRVRLKASVDTSGFSPEVQVLLEGLKKYGMFLADNGSDWYITGAPHKDWSDDNLHELGEIQGGDFEAVETGPLKKGF